MLPFSSVDLMVEVNLLTELNAILFTESMSMFAVIAYLFDSFFCDMGFYNNFGL